MDAGTQPFVGVAASRRGAGPSPTWRNPGLFGRVAGDVTWRSGWLAAQESELSAACGRVLEVTPWLAGPEPPNVWRGVPLMRNQCAAVGVLLNRAPSVALSYGVLAGVSTALTKRLAGATVVRLILAGHG